MKQPEDTPFEQFTRAVRELSVLLRHRVLNGWGHTVIRVVGHGTKHWCVECKRWFGRQR